MKTVSLSLPVEDRQVDLLLSPAEAARLLIQLAHSIRISAIVSFNDLTRVEVSLKQRGGKGGFGKLLKSQRNLGKNTDNFDSCRDLEGRKLKHSRREEKVESLMKKDKRDERKDTLESQPAKSAVMLDDAYIKTLSKISQEKQEAIAEGLKASKEPVNPIKVDEPPVKKIKKMAFFDEEDSE